MIEIDDDMFVMEPAAEQNKEYSHVAHKIKRKPIMFENKGTSHIQYWFLAILYVILLITQCYSANTIMLFVLYK